MKNTFPETSDRRFFSTKTDPDIDFDLLFTRAAARALFLIAYTLKFSKASWSFGHTSNRSFTIP